jgi:hypothetical protein
MKALRSPVVWFRKHWKMLFVRPKNGHESMREIDSSLREIRRSRRRVCAVVAKMVEETKAGERMIEENAPSRGHT